MKIKDKDLRKSYQSFIRKNQAKGKDCPQIEVLINTFSNESKEKEKLKFIDHISECSACFKKFEAIKPFFKEGKKIKDKLEKISLSEQEAKELKQKAKEKIFELKKHPKKRRSTLFFPRLRLVQLSAVAGLLIIVLGAVLIFKAPEDSKTDIIRGKDEKTIQLITPKGDVKKRPIIFEWTHFPKAKEYEVRLMDEELTKIWVSNKTGETKIELPADIAQKIEKEKQYYWKVFIYIRFS